MGKIILASSSPRRADILKKLNFDFEIVPSSYVEEHNRTDFSYDFIENLAYNKAKAVVPLVQEPALIIGADTIVVLDGKIHILGGMATNTENKHCYVNGNDYKHITALLPAGIHILLPDNMDIKYVSDNAVISANNIIEVKATGLTEVVAEYTDPDNVLDYLTFY